MRKLSNWTEDINLFSKTEVQLYQYMQQYSKIISEKSILMMCLSLILSFSEKGDHILL